MKTLRQQAINVISDSLAIIPLNLQDHLLLYDGRVVGMTHQNHKTARLNGAPNDLMDYLINEGYKVQTTSEPFILAEWSLTGVTSCGAIIKETN